jgi:hypothetical protein
MKTKKEIIDGIINEANNEMILAMEKTKANNEMITEKYNTTLMIFVFIIFTLTLTAAVLMWTVLIGGIISGARIMSAMAIGIIGVVCIFFLVRWCFGLTMAFKSAIRNNNAKLDKEIELIRTRCQERIYRENASVQYASSASVSADEESF